jgi:hypothetical protein
MLLSVLLPGPSDARNSLPMAQKMSEIKANVTKLLQSYGQFLEENVEQSRVGKSAKQSK